MMINHRHRDQLQHHARTIQSRATAITALFMTVFLLCIEHVRAFANQYHISAHDAMVLASAASSLTRKLGSAYLPKGGGAFSQSKQQQQHDGSNDSSIRSTTRLHVWSIPAISVAMPDMPAMPTTKDIPLHALGSWYSEVDPTTKPPVYDDDYDNSSYSFSSPTDDWPSISSSTDEASAAAVRSHMRKGPLKTIRRVASRFKDILVQ